MSRNVAGDILDAAERCFYAAGIAATGVDRLADEAGVSKRTLYNHFGSKEAVLVAYLRRREEQWRVRLERAIADMSSLDEQIRAYVRAYWEFSSPEMQRGCAFVNASAELVEDDHPGLAIIRSSIDLIENDVARILADAGVEAPLVVARQVLLVLEGALAVSGIRRNREIFEAAEAMVLSLVRAALPAGV